MPSWQAAQRNAALHACHQLYKMKELNDILEVPLNAELCHELDNLTLCQNPTPVVQPTEEDEILCDLIVRKSL